MFYVKTMLRIAYFLITWLTMQTQKVARCKTAKRDRNSSTARKRKKYFKTTSFSTIHVFKWHLNHHNIHTYPEGSAERQHQTRLKKYKLINKCIGTINMLINTFIRTINRTNQTIETTHVCMVWEIISENVCQCVKKTTIPNTAFIVPRCSVTVTVAMEARTSMMVVARALVLSHILFSCFIGPIKNMVLWKHDVTC